MEVPEIPMLFEDARLRLLQDAEDKYYLTAKLASCASRLIESSEPDEKRELLGSVLLNTKLDGENLVYELRKLFDVLVNYTSSQS